MPPRRRIASGEVTHNSAFAASTCATVIIRLTANPPASDYTGYALGRLPASAGPQPITPSGIERRTGPCAFYHGPCATLRGIKRCAGPCASSHGVGRGPHEAWHRRLLRDAMRHIYFPHLVGQGSCLPPHHLSGTLAHAAAGGASRTCRRILSQRRCGAARARACRHAGRRPGAIATTRVVPQASLNRRAPRCGRRHSRVRSGPRPLAPRVVQVALRLWVEHRAGRDGH